MPLDSKTLDSIAHLARLSLSDETRADIASDLDNILDLVGKISAANTQDISPLSSPVSFPQPLREDAVTEQNQRDNLMKNAPNQEGGAFLVPRVIE